MNQTETLPDRALSGSKRNFLFSMMTKKVTKSMSKDTSSLNQPTSPPAPAASTLQRSSVATKPSKKGGHEFISAHKMSSIVDVDDVVCVVDVDEKDIPDEIRPVKLDNVVSWDSQQQQEQKIIPSDSSKRTQSSQVTRLAAAGKGRPEVVQFIPSSSTAQDDKFEEEITKKKREATKLGRDAAENDTDAAEVKVDETMLNKIHSQPSTGRKRVRKRSFFMLWLKRSSKAQEHPQPSDEHPEKKEPEVNSSQSSRRGFRGVLKAFGLRLHVKDNTEVESTSRCMNTSPLSSTTSQGKEEVSPTSSPPDNNDLQNRTNSTNVRPETVSTAGKRSHTFTSTSTNLIHVNVPVSRRKSSTSIQRTASGSPIPKASTVGALYSSDRSGICGRKNPASASYVIDSISTNNNDNKSNRAESRFKIGPRLSQMMLEGLSSFEAKPISSMVQKFLRPADEENEEDLQSPWGLPRNELADNATAEENVASPITRFRAAVGLSKREEEGKSRECDEEDMEGEAQNSSCKDEQSTTLELTQDDYVDFFASKDKVRGLRWK